MAKVKEVTQLLKSIAPEEFVVKDGYDNVGLLVGKNSAEVKAVLCCLDVTEEVISEAAELSAELIISHHPMIFNPIKSVTDGDILGRKIITAIENGISIYSAHTNLDFVRDGINQFTAELLGLKNIETLEPYISRDEGLGRVGNLSEQMYCTVFKGTVESAFKDSYVRIIGEPYSTVSRVAVINGAGGGDTRYIDMALGAGADCLVTADVKHHVAVYAKENGLTVIEPQHYTMEHAYIARLVRLLRMEAEADRLEVEFIQSEKDINPRF